MNRMAQESIPRAPTTGFEPATTGLTTRCSTNELRKLVTYRTRLSRPRQVVVFHFLATGGTPIGMCPRILDSMPDCVFYSGFPPAPSFRVLFLTLAVDFRVSFCVTEITASYTRVIPTVSVF